MMYIAVILNHCCLVILLYQRQIEYHLNWLARKLALYFRQIAGCSSIIFLVGCHSVYDSHITNMAKAVKVTQ